jgi:predicted DNA-binding protein (MmcQ/YjbR family)
MCAAVVAAAAEAPSGAVFGPFSCSFLLVVLELLSQKLLSLREMCAGIHPAYHLNGEAMQAWREGLRAQAYNRAGQAVAAVLSFL